MSYPKHQIVKDLAILNGTLVTEAYKMAVDLGPTSQGVDLKEKIQAILFRLNEIGDKVGKCLITNKEEKDESIVRDCFSGGVVV